MKKLFIGLLFASTYSLAGGWFSLSIGQPGAHPDPQAHTAAFTIQVYGCSARAAEVTATAEGLVDGKRVSVPLQLTQYKRSEGLVDLPPQVIVKAVAAKVLDGNTSKAILTIKL